MADWQQFEQRIQELERKRKPSQNRRAVFEVIKSSNLQPHPDFDASLYLGPLVDLAGQPICLEYTNDRPNLWFHARHAEMLEKAGCKLERKPPVGAESEGRHAGLKGKGFKDIDAFRLGGLDPAATRSALAALGMLKAEGGDLKLSDAAVSRWISRLRHFFPSLDRFTRPDLDFDEKERSYKLETAAALRSGLENSEDDETLLQSVLGALQKSNLLQWRVYWPMTPKGDGDSRRLALAFRALAAAADGPAEGHAAALAEFGAAWTEAVPDAQRDHARQIGEFILMHLVPETGIYIRHSVREGLWREGFGTKFPGSADLGETYRNELIFMQAVREAFTERGLAPRDMIDVQGALWVIHNYADEDAPARPENAMSDSEAANNLVLYGPPGTGKTFETAAEAVRLCEVDAPDDRSQLMAVYQRLLAAGRIEFVTFHQSMSYEEFVEGLRPETPAKEGPEPESDEVDTPGFRLKVEDGVFKRICERARLDPGKTSGDRRLDRTRPIFKVALGRRGQEETQIRAALDANEVRHGWSGSIDWSDERFEDWAEIKNELERTTGKDVSSHAGELVCTYSFRSDIQVGDYVVVSDGRDGMRAFGTVTSDYLFDADAEHDPHRRKVEWLWRDDQGAERARFYPNGFRQHTVYKLNGDLVDWDGLEEVVLGVDRSIPVESARPYVLIIDEINRANISKVFGELITLLEPDKRLRADNEVRLTLPYSKRLFGVPSNLHVIGTMNTADRSIALLDTALRRRFTFREMMPEASVLEEAGEKCGVDLPRLLATINERIEYLYDREHQIGHAYFTACRSRADVDEVMRHKVIPLLAEYFFEDWAKIAAVLGDLEPGEGSISGGFLKRAVLKPPPGLEDGDAVVRFRWQVRSVDEGFDYSKLVET